MDGESFGDFLLFGGVDLSEWYWGFSGFKGLGGFGVFWGEFFTVSTPWGVEFDEGEFVFGDEVIEVIVSKNDDSFFFGPLGAGA